METAGKVELGMDSAKHIEDQQVPIERIGFLGHSQLMTVKKKTTLMVTTLPKLRTLLTQKSKLVKSQAESTWKEVAASQKCDGDLFVRILRLFQKQTEDHHSMKQLLSLNAVYALFS